MSINWKRTMAVAALAAVAMILTTPAMAQDDRFAIRFGLIGFFPSNDSTIESTTIGLEDSIGAEFDFEWYALPRLGLEASFAVALDSNIESEIDAAVGVTYTPLTLGLNGHIIRTRTLDWSVGVVGGVIWFTDFDIRNLEDDPVASSDTVRETTYGAQTSLDVGFGEFGFPIGRVPRVRVPRVRVPQAGLPVSQARVPRARSPQSRFPSPRSPVQVPQCE